ncbi:MAG TPA: cytochrome c [Vicinamibacterales bacterium]|jgi:mono/diheme cytochrome c family protein|nr:cytochrome c [Vicinamibacterales bacterium]
MAISFKTLRILQLAVFSTGVMLAGAVSASAQDAAVVKKGEQVYAAQKCATCHSIAGKGKKTGGALDGVGTKLSADELKQWILDPKGMAAKAKSTKKPPMAAKYGGLPPADVDALVAYMQSLK